MIVLSCTTFELYFICTYCTVYSYTVYFLSVYLYICLSVYPSLFLAFYLFIFLSVYLSVYPSIFLSVCLFVYLSVCLSVCLSVDLSNMAYRAHHPHIYSFQKRCFDILGQNNLLTLKSPKKIALWLNLKKGKKGSFWPWSTKEATF